MSLSSLNKIYSNNSHYSLFAALAKSLISMKAYPRMSKAKSSLREKEREREREREIQQVERERKGGRERDQ